MNPYRLVYWEGDEEQEHTFDEGVLVMGRAPDCQIVVPDYTVSRRHASITTRDGTVVLTDLDSKNGTHVNGVLVQEATLHDGDKIALGNFPLKFREDLRSRVVLDDAVREHDDSSTIIRPISEATARLERVDAPAVSANGSALASEAKAAPGRVTPGRVLQMLNDLARELLGVHQLDELLQHVMELVFEYVPAERGCIMLVDERDESKIVPVVMKHRRASKSNETVSVSRTISSMAMRDGVAILSSDAQLDGRFNAEESVRLCGIHSAMCAPLWTQGHSIGVIHVDCLLTITCFTGEDLDLLTAMANFTAIAIERARLHTRITTEERKRTRLGRFLSPQVTARVLAAPDDEQGALASRAPEQRNVSVMFADIVGFTTRSEKSDPVSVANLLNDFLTQMTDVIFSFEGTLDKYIGDAIMAVFGAPLDMHDHAQRAVRAALAMRERLEEFNAERSELEPIRMRIAINSGPVVATEIGGANKREYTVLGDTVNVASRLESDVATPDMIVVGPHTHATMGPFFECRSLGSRRLRGRKVEMEAFEVDGLRLAVEEIPGREEAAPLR